MPGQAAFTLLRWSMGDLLSFLVFLTWIEFCFGKRNMAGCPDLGADTRWQA